MEKFIFSVSELNRYVRSIVEGDKNLASLYVGGEISNFTDHYRSGHLYFSLTDGNSTVKCVMFKSAAAWLKFRPENGMAVICRGRASVYERDGVYQFYCEDMQPDGVGSAALAFEQLKEKLAKEGLFSAEKKRPLPVYPSKIGVITSSTGAALQDIINVTSRRYPCAEIIFHSALVQGIDAPKSLIEALGKMYGTDAEIIIIGRGGGSAEDLSAFNDEALARKIAESPVPVISAVGHETDFSICDFVADMRAPTPSAAAELALPDREELKINIENICHKISSLAVAILRENAIKLERLKGSDVLKRPEGYFEMKQQDLDGLSNRMRTAYTDSVKGEASKLSVLVSKLDTLSPLKVMQRGYAHILRMGETVSKAAQVTRGDNLDVRFADGVARCEVKEVEVEI